MRFISLSRKHGQGQYAIVDDEYYNQLSRFSWHLSGRGYARNSHGERMSGLVIGARPRQEVDHKNRNRLDNQRGNLRFASRSQNEANKPKRLPSSHGFKGVSIKKGGYIQASIKVEGRYIHLGTFATTKAAAQAYNTAAKNYFGQFAFLNPL